ncbi:two-component system sensor histidine kinase NtrB [Altererythrobacter aquiaggeris]|uniref:two-component system sensor histidine kinase NtrB n=1 Tax=Aestuarierythrobacter aquiaggeris TaxID=1898396 RepID=UPI003015C5F0
MTGAAARLVASLPLAIFTIKPDLTIASANPAAEHLTTLGTKRLIGRQINDVLTFADHKLADRVAASDGELLAHGAVISIGELPERKFDLSLSPLLGKEGWQALTLSEAENGNAQSPDMESSILRAPAILSHEIKNPLAAIGGASQLLGRKLAGKELDLTKLITREVGRIASLIDRMQTLGSEMPEPAGACNLHEAIRRARAVVETADAQPVTLTEEFDPSLPSVHANQDALEQVLINLLSNAMHACAASEEPRITVRTRFASGLKLNVLRLGRSIQLPIEVSIIDNGAGVDKSVSDHIFEPFVSTRKDGQGLGLALVSKLVRDMNGRIAHDRDERNSLTIFRLHLPVAP